MKPDPLGEPRNEFHVLALVTALAMGVAALSGLYGPLIVPDLPSWGEAAWGGTATLGSALTIAGMFWQRDIRTGVVLEFAGYVGLTATSVVYALDALFVGPPSWVVAGVAACYGGACASRAVRLQRMIRRAVVAP